MIPVLEPADRALLDDPAIVAAIKEHAVACYPEESCGIVARMPGYAPGYVPLENVAIEKPDEERSGPRYRFDCTEQLAPWLLRNAVVALVHSHPDGPAGPSSHDMRQQRAMALPWGIVMSDKDGNVSAPYYWGDQLAPPALLGRQFRHGPSGTDGRGDCGAFVRDWYRENRGVLINDYPRDDRWWKAGKALYLDNYLDVGFRRVDPATPRVGDLILMAVLSDTANHSAIFVGDHLLVHHLENRLSRAEPVLRWRNQIRAWLRHESDPE